jgi:hypothetical protein
MYTGIRKEVFKSVAPSVPLPPEPNLTRWGTWLCAASYYTEHLETVRNVVNTFDPKSAALIQTAQDVLKIAEQKLIFPAHFSHLPSTISSLEASNSNNTL